MKFAKLFEDHTQWELDEYRAKNKTTGVSLWVANGAFFFTGDNGHAYFGLVERHILWRLFKQMVNRKALGEPT